jgi:hypothetical protein
MKFNPQFVMSRDGNLTGEVIGETRCQLSGCNGICSTVRWNVPSKKRKTSITRPCSKGMKPVEGKENTWIII